MPNPSRGSKYRNHSTLELEVISGRFCSCSIRSYGACPHRARITTDFQSERNNKGRGRALA